MWGEAVPGREPQSLLDDDDRLSLIALKPGRASFWAVPEGLFLKRHLTLMMMEAICKGLAPQGEKRVSKPEQVILGLST